MAAAPVAKSAGFSQTVKQKCTQGEDAIINALFHLQCAKGDETWWYHGKEEKPRGSKIWIDKIYGPYTAAQLHSWYSGGKLPGFTLIRKGKSGIFMQLSSLARGHKSGNPFEDVPECDRQDLMKDAYCSVVEVLAALRVTQ